MGTHNIEIAFGALVAPLVDQLAARDLRDAKVKLHQRQADAICILAIGGLMSESVVRNVRRRLIKKIAATVTRRNHHGNA